MIQKDCIAVINVGHPTFPSVNPLAKVAYSHHVGYKAPARRQIVGNSVRNYLYLIKTAVVLMTPITDLNFNDPVVFFVAVFALFVIVFLRYLIISGTYHYLFFKLLHTQYHQKFITSKPITGQQAKREVLWSLIGSVVFAFAGVGMVWLWQQEYTAIYTSFEKYPVWYIPISILALLLIHDTYYYWLHRWMHRPGVYRLMHKVHHDSIQTSVLTSFSFHPIEAVLQAVIIPIIIIFLPMHLYAVLFVLVFMTLSATINHAGVEVYPTPWAKHWLAKWLIGATHHDHHHKKFNYNYGLYFTFWDQLMGTEAYHEPEYTKPLKKTKEKTSLESVLDKRK